MDVDEKIEKRMNIKFLVKLGKSSHEINEMMRAVYKENAPKKTTLFKWIKRFSDGREDVNDDARPGRPSSSCFDENIERVRRMVFSDRRLTIRMIADNLYLQKSSVHSILRNHLGLRKLCAKIVPQILTSDQKMKRIECCNQWKDFSQTSGFVERIITGDESWFYQYDIESKSQSMEWKAKGETRPKKCRKIQSKIKVMLLVFFDIRGIVHHEYLPEGQTVNSNFYVNVLKRLMSRVRRVRRNLCNDDGWLLHHDNAPAHSAINVREFLSRNSIRILDHPPYSPDLAPCDFFLFPKCKSVMKGRYWDDVKTIKNETTRHLKNLTSEEFQGCFEQWKRRWDKCIAVNGEYFEGDNINVHKVL